MRQGQLLLSTALTLATLVSASCAQDSKVIEKAAAVIKPADDKPVVILETSAGTITIELEPAKTPITVENFLKYVDSGFFDGLVFHRVIESFMIQGGGMKVDGNSLSEKKPTYGQIKNESRNGLSNTKGTIAMARTGNPNSATSQFFINHGDNKFLDFESRSSGGGYTAFGKVIDGMDVVDAIAKTQTDNSEPGKSGTGGVPLKPIVIKSAKRKPKS